MESADAQHLKSCTFKGLRAEPCQAVSNPYRWHLQVKPRHIWSQVVEPAWIIPAGPPATGARCFLLRQLLPMVWENRRKQPLPRYFRRR